MVGYIEKRQIPGVVYNSIIVIDSKGEISFKKGFSYPLIGEQVFVINMDTVDFIYNSKVKESIGFTKKTTVADPRKDPRVGVLRTCFSWRRPIRCNGQSPQG